MFKRVKKLISTINFQRKYRPVFYFGAPWFLKLFGIAVCKLPEGFNSQVGQDKIALDLLQRLDRTNGSEVYIDVGCNHPTIHNNSYFFEKQFGYRVIAIDALPEMRDLWAAERPSATFVESAVGKCFGEVEFNATSGDQISSMFSAVVGSSNKAEGLNHKTRVVKLRPLSSILKEFRISRASIVSIDVEGFELDAIMGIDFTSFRSDIFIIENNSVYGAGNNDVREIMLSNGYTLYARIWNMDDIWVYTGRANSGFMRAMNPFQRLPLKF